ncbi:MAG: TonB-dependent receptor [Ignavibacteria bacterium]|jgi:outer membrane receptor protein involved in Fe transport|nr:TonB-dependent receptor [Ignavibacteria bacterium]MCU7501609.1 TonB-dependent receptor [Ignavibacteria bacterium]MCU7517146.1 TonB-dependent receptor [Ignavibacteria bacterium]
MQKKFLTMILMLMVTLSQNLLAGITGKIAGKVTDLETGEALVGVNVVLDGTTLGAATDIEGFYTINNIPPGIYTINASAVGYQKKQVLNVRVSADFTTRLDIQISSTTTTLNTVVITAEAPLIRKDLTSSQTSVDAGQISSLPVESVNQILSLQAGFVQGSGGELHIRGGRSTEIAYAVNGVSISNPFDNSRTVEISTNAIQELSVVSGTFNAEYGNALSGIVNTITKEGGNKYQGYLSFYTGDYLSTHSNVFYNIKDVNPLNSNVSEVTLSGPIPFAGDYLSFFASGRYSDDKGYIYGIRQHRTEDSVYRNPQNPDDIRIISTGDGAAVSMNPSRDLSSTFKLTFRPISTIKINYDLVYSNSFYKNYDHDLKYDPDGNYNNYEWGLLNSVEVRHAVSNSTFYTFKGSYNLNDFKQYLYPLLDAGGSSVDYYPGMGTSTLHADPRYENRDRTIPVMNYTFASGGTLNDHYYQRSMSLGVKFDFTSQLDKYHEMKFGIDFKSHKLEFENFEVIKEDAAPEIPEMSSPKHDYYTKKPLEFSSYIQDKMEFESIILNIGLRYDYFASRSPYSVDTFHPSPNDPKLPPQIDAGSLLADAPAKQQLSPRIGISYPITDKGIIHLSYGHFYQMPPFQYLYSNANFKTSFTSGFPTYGNANLNPERTVSYEFGLQQQLTDNLAFNLTAFYKDVRDLLALQQVRISTQETYNKYVNKDYGSIKGITFSLYKRRNVDEFFGASLDYTYQVAEGNETSADAFFLDLSSGRQSEKVPVLLNWDQSHTLNASLLIGHESWNVTLVGRLGTGLPYTPQIISGKIYLPTNSDRKPSQMSVDLLADKSFNILDFTFTVFLKVYNLFDALNERYVYDDTGRATYSIEEQMGSAQNTNEKAAKIPGMHSATEYFVRPNYYLAPRNVKVGVSVKF